MERLLNWSFHLGTVSRIAVKVHWTLLAFALFWLFDGPDIKLNAIITLALFLSVLLHEFGHALAARAVGGESDEILLWPLGGLAFLRHPGDLKDDLKVVLAGPAVHIPIALACVGGAVALGEPFSFDYFLPYWENLPSTYWAFILVSIAKIQMVLFLFNMFVPAYPLDSGRIVLNCILLAGAGKETAARTIIGLSIAVGVFLLVWRQEILISLLIFYSAYQIYDLYRRHALDAHPLFALAGSHRPNRPSLPRHLRLVTKGKQCPYCQRSLPEAAKMCGYCEKVI